MRRDHRPDPAGVAGCCFALAALLIVVAQLATLLDP
jgi:hypothetical protein